MSDQTGDRVGAPVPPGGQPEEQHDPEAPRRREFGKLFSDLTGLGVDWRTAVLVPALAILTALIVSAVIIFVTDLDLWRDFGADTAGDTFGEVRDAFTALFTGSLGSLRAISETLVASAPLILGGLSVAIGFRAGLFNIGTEGQILMGGMAAAYVGFAFSLPMLLHLPIVIVAAIIGGGIWGGIPGFLRARTGAHEVITTIMLNSIAIFLVDYLLTNSLFQAAGRQDPVSKSIAETARFPRMLDELRGTEFVSPPDLRLHFGIIVALLAAYAVYWLLFKSTIGFEFRAVGANPDAARYAGMSVTFLYVAVMAVAGALGGLAGSMQINGVLYRVTPGFSAKIGFDAISLALLGRSHPAGVVVAGLLFGALRAGGQQMQVASNIAIDLIFVIQALIVVFIAAPALIRAIYRVKTGEGAGQLTKGWAT